MALSKPIGMGKERGTEKLVWGLT